MAKLWLLLSVALLMSHAGRACDETINDEQLAAAAARQDSVDYLAKAYGFFPNPWDSPYYFQQNSRAPEYAGPYEGRTPFRPSSSNPFSKYYNKNNADDEQPVAAEGRFGNLGASILNAGLFNNRYTASGTTFRPFAGIANRLPIQINPNFGSSLSAFDSCTSPSGESGICSPGAVCSLFGGRPSGSCLLGGVCCINAITTCGGTVTLNNTYWQSPTTAVGSPSTCSLTVKLDSKLVEQKKPICQVRLDFVSFTISQPAATSVCSNDMFQVGGAKNKPPTICGENNGQHMYLEVPSSATSPTDLQLLFNFGSTATTRSWNIKIAMIPCGAAYQAPADCLQYFTATTGKVSSFNWKDVAVASGTRQLALQDYNICFRTELIDNQKASKICFSVCSVPNGGNPFLISKPAAVGAPTSGAFCSNKDFLIIAGGDDGNTANQADRYCGGALNGSPNAGITAAANPICTTIKQFRISFRTDGTEIAGATEEPNDSGFCLTFTEQ